MKKKKNIGENMENNLYFIGTKINLKKLTTHVGLVGDNEVAYFDFWNNVCIIEYNTKTNVYIVKDNLLEPQYYTCISQLKCVHFLKKRKTPGEKSGCIID